MGKRGPKPKKIINEEWRPDLAYAVGLIATDGCLSKDGLLIDLTSNDREQLLNFSKSVGVNFNIVSKWSGTGNKSLRIQFKNRIFYDFLLSIGLTPKKSLTMGKLAIPSEYFYDFLRGCFDGDGTFYSYWDPRWKSSHMFYLEFISASREHIDWIREELKNRVGVLGHIGKDGKSSSFQLKYAKKEALEVIGKIYYNPKVICLSRKKIKIQKALKIEQKQQKIYKMKK
jgi:6-phosphofructokinase